MAQLWDPDIAFDPSDARRLVESQFPEFTGARLEPFGAGWDNQLYLMNDEWVLRFPVRHIAAPLIGHELAALPYLAERLPLPIPHPKLAGQPDAGYPFRWLGYRRLGGEVLNRLDPVPATPAMARQLGEFLTALHRADPEAVVLDGDAHDKAALGARFDQLSERMDKLVAEGVVSVDVARHAVDEARILSRTAPWTARPRIVHGDLYGYHVLSDGARITGVIDWGDVHLGDPGLDLSIGYGWFEGAARHAFFEAYGPIDSATHARARFRALYYAPVLILYGRDIDDDDVEAVGWRALRLAG